MRTPIKIAVIGANGHTGRIVVADALASGHEVIAVARTHELLETGEDNPTKARADVREPHALPRGTMPAVTARHTSTKSSSRPRGRKGR